MNNSQSGWTALIRAAENGHADCARLLLDAGADAKVKDNVRRRLQRDLLLDSLISHLSFVSSIAIASQHHCPAILNI